MDRFTAEAQITAGEDTNMALDLKYNLMQTAQFVVTAKLGLEYLGEDQVNYEWYGDKGSLNNDSATNVTLGVTAIQTLNPSWKLLYGVQTTSLDDEIDDSPVGQDDSYTVAIFRRRLQFLSSVTGNKHISRISIDSLTCVVSRNMCFILPIRWSAVL